MRTKRTALVLLLMLFAWVGPAAEARYVVLITIDGFPASTFWDAELAIPKIRQVARQGVAAEGMRISNPATTWANHTTLVTGARAEKHSVLFNGLVVRSGPRAPVRIDSERDQADLVAVPTLFEVLHEKGCRTAAINWPCTRNSLSLDDNFPDVPGNLEHTTPRLRQELMAQGILTNETDAAFKALSRSERDEVWTKAACLVIQRRKPHLLLLHLLNTDSVQHRYGPQSPASYRALRLADGCVGQVLEALEAAGIHNQTTVFVTADHGFARVNNTLQPNVLLRAAGLLEVGASNQITKASAHVVPEGGTGMVYLTNPETREADRRKVLDIFTGKTGITEMILPDQFTSLGLPSPEQNQRMADLILVAADGYGVSVSAAGKDFVVPVDPYSNLGYHGYLASNPKMNAAFIVAGPGIKHGVKIGMVDNIDVAPTIAHLLGQNLRLADGKVMTEVLLSP